MEGILTDESGLIYMRSRYYSADLMRFINEDIVVGNISNSNSLNRYAYVNGNPVLLINPFGMCAERVSAGVNGILDVADSARMAYSVYNKNRFGLAFTI